MTTSGWLVMLFSVGAVTCLLAVCLYLVFRRADRADRLHGLESETPDVDAP
jgi:uncharacterized membrane protein YwaF